MQAFEQHYYPSTLCQARCDSKMCVKIFQSLVHSAFLKCALLSEHYTRETCITVLSLWLYFEDNASSTNQIKLNYLVDAYSIIMTGLP